ncbi:MAG: ABC transporter ATP-binding protein [Clostridia bacterium]|nr:ABC transporter ATP-binding protein [Clostridia bacterium]
MIEIKSVSKRYNKDEKDTIKDLNLSVNNGEIFAFLGPNGAGKTTTIKMMTGILAIDRGDILIDGKSIATTPIEAKKNIGLVPDSPDMFLKLKGIEYLNFISDIYDISIEIRNKRIQKYANDLEIYDILNDRIETYSHGTRQKIVIIGLLLHNPKNWILDEPLSGLDPKSAFYLKEKMKEHAKNGGTVFFSTHILEVAEKLCDTIGIIDKGNLILLGTYKEIKEKFKEDNSLEEIFMEITKNDRKNK